MRFHKYLREAIHAKNIGFEEMILFSRTATNKEIDIMDKIVKREDWKAFKKLIKKVLGIKLK